MSKSKKKVVTTRKTTTKTVKTSPTVSRKRSTPSASSSRMPLIFDKTNYIFMVAGIGLIALGLILMQGGAMPSPDVWDESLIYSKRRTVLAPFVILLGLGLEIYAIFKKTDTNQEADTAA